MGIRRYNFIFPKLVGEKPADPGQPQNILGLLAYGIYKQEKMAYIEEFKRKHDERDPEEHELDEFHTTSVARIPQYLRDAERQLSEFTDGIIKDNLADFKRAAAEGEKEALAELVKTHEAGIARIAAECKTEIGTLRSPWWKSLGAWCGSGIFGNAAFLLIIALLAVIFRSWLADVVGNAIKAATGAS